MREFSAVDGGRRRKKSKSDMEEEDLKSHKFFIQEFSLSQLQCDRGTKI